MRLDEALVRLRTRLRDDPDLAGQIKAAVMAGSAIQNRIAVAQKSSGGTRVNLDVRSSTGHNIHVPDVASP